MESTGIELSASDGVGDRQRVALETILRRIRARRDEMEAFDRQVFEAMEL